MWVTSSPAIWKSSTCRAPGNSRRIRTQVVANVPKPEEATTPEDEAQAREAFSHIKHVLYIIRENRTYDQVFGDLGRGNGDPKLVLFGNDITPNAHELANQTVILDNIYVNGEVSEDGHQWSNAAYATNFTEKAVAFHYSSRGEPEADEKLTASPAGYLWDNCRKHGLTFVSYGEFASLRADAGPCPEISGGEGSSGALQQRLAERHDEGGARDPDKVPFFIDDLHRAEQTGNWWQFMVMHLPEDHTRGLSAGSYTPKAMAGSNDVALGRVVEAVSHSRFWAETAIFVIEDDAQNGPDHVDVHRTVGLVISPYTKQGFVDSTHYTTASMVHTMELILGLPTMTQYDRAATPMYRSFQSHANLWAFQTRTPQTDLRGQEPGDGAGRRGVRQARFLRLGSRRSRRVEQDSVGSAAAGRAHARPGSQRGAPARTVRVRLKGKVCRVKGSGSGSYGAFNWNRIFTMERRPHCFRLRHGQRLFIPGHTLAYLLCPYH